MLGLVGENDGQAVCDLGRIDGLRVGQFAVVIGEAADDGVVVVDQPQDIGLNGDVVCGGSSRPFCSQHR